MHLPRFFKDQTLPWQEKIIASATIAQISRHGKFLIIELKTKNPAPLFLLSHLGMSGAWIISPEELKTTKHVHLSFEGESSTENKKTYLSYVDPRRFGRLALLDQEMLAQKLASLGPDLTSDSFDEGHWKKCIQRFPERQIKVTLLDQKLFAGIGNYMASEICAHAGIRPTRRCSHITRHEISRLRQAAKLVVEGAISEGGATFAGGYQDTTGSDGGGLSNLVVFWQKTCQLCRKTPIKKIYLAGRGTYYCSLCQK